jgi:hypothetical protein
MFFPPGRGAMSRSRHIDTITNSSPARLPYRAETVADRIGGNAEYDRIHPLDPAPGCLMGEVAHPRSCLAVPCSGRGELCGCYQVNRAAREGLKVILEYLECVLKQPKNPPGGNRQTPGGSPGSAPSATGAGDTQGADMAKQQDRDGRLTTAVEIKRCAAFRTHRHKIQPAARNSALVLAIDRV